MYRKLVITLPFYLMLMNVCFAADSAVLQVRGIVPNEVVQRVGFEANVGNGYADVAIHCEIPVELSIPSSATWQYRVVGLGDNATKPDLWNRLRPNVDSHLEQTVGSGVARIAAGGWYRLEIQCKDDISILAQASVEPIGVGEVLVIAGQSYCTNCNDERLVVMDPAQRVVAMSTPAGPWNVANDPQPVHDGSDGGSIWPPVGDSLAEALGVPIGFANVGIGGTHSAQWLPGGAFHQNLVATGKKLGRFRAVLWQQGESDVIGKTTTDQYVANIQLIEKAASAAWIQRPVWLLAKSTHHPTVYNDPVGENAIRQADDLLCTAFPFQAGPDTDTLRDENRGGLESRQHFTAIGQRRAASLWVETLKQLIATPKPSSDKLSTLLPTLHLWDACCSDPTIYREGSVLLQMQDDGPITARLAFPADKIVEVISVSGSQVFEQDRDFRLSEDRLTLIFLNTHSIAPISASQFFPAVDSPNSYKHRAGNPEQNLLYRPGRWFHDHNVEITYRRTSQSSEPPANIAPLGFTLGQLPRTMARLKAKEPITIGISGDSISTGADASVVSNAFPYQPGFAELFAAHLQNTFGSEVTLKNRAVGGWSVANGVEDLNNLLAEKPNLVVVAYGMNDVGVRNPQWYHDQTETILRRIQSADPTTEVLLVSPMLGHKEWVHTPREMFGQYRDQLKLLVGPGVALADLTQVWTIMLEHKHDFDLTGNGLNHPNDFGHRLYAQTLLSLFNTRNEK